MSKSTVKPAEGKLGVLVVGLGAVSSTFMTGVLMARKGLAKPVGSMTQYDKIRVGKGADHLSTTTHAPTCIYVCMGKCRHVWHLQLTLLE